MSEEVSIEFRLAGESESVIINMTYMIPRLVDLLESGTIEEVKLHRTAVKRTSEARVLKLGQPDRIRCTKDNPLGQDRRVQNRVGRRTVADWRSLVCSLFAGRSPDFRRVIRRQERRRKS